MQGKQILLSQGKEDFPFSQTREAKHVPPLVQGRNIFLHHFVSAGLGLGCSSRLAGQALQQD